MVIILKIVINIIKRLLFSFFLLFGLNVMIKSLGIILPINWFNIVTITILGIPGLIGLLIIKMFII
jgi:hypothetical protein